LSTFDESHPTCDEGLRNIGNNHDSWPTSPRRQWLMPDGALRFQFLFCPFSFTL
jgi:hypothetical protein